MSKKSKAKTPKRIYFVVSDDDKDNVAWAYVHDKKSVAKTMRDRWNGDPMLPSDHRIVTYERKP